jgi:hypothetical protein
MDLSTSTLATCHPCIGATCHPCSGATCHNLTCPPVILVSTPLYLPRHYTVVRPVQSTSMSSLYGLHNHQILHVWENKQITIYLAYDVSFNPFKLHWVRNNKAYVHVCFEVILSTLSFRPSWTHFGSWIHSGSHLPTKHLLVLQKVTN